MQIKDRLHSEYSELLRVAKENNLLEDRLHKLVICKEILDAFPDDQELQPIILKKLQAVPADENLLQTIFEKGYLETNLDFGKLLINSYFGLL